MPLDALVRHWPVAGLVVRTPRLELRLPDLDELVALADLAAKGVHDESYMPFMIPWTREPAGGPRERSSIQWNLLQWAQWKPDDWHYNPVVFVDGEVVGMQGAHAQHYGVTRTAGTGSWLGIEHQRKGIGKEMRAAMLHLFFDGLGAVRMETGAFEDNHASLGVTRSLGYRPNGESHFDREGERVVEQRFVMDRADWEPTRRDDIEIVGLEPCLPHFGIEPSGG